MNEKALNSLIEEISHEEVVANTIRYPKKVDQEIRALCERTPGLKLSNVLRWCLMKGWESLNDNR